MKKDLHPSTYREVAFKDMSNEEVFITRSTVAAKETIEVDGVTYPQHLMPTFFRGSVLKNILLIDLCPYQNQNPGQHG